jgi:hypothetical protein
MRKSAVRFLTLAICTVVVAPTVTPAEARAHNSRHIKQHRIKPLGFGDQPRPARPLTQSGEVCPGNARGFECKIWPPPIYDDPDRRNTSSDGGG